MSWDHPIWLLLTAPWAGVLLIVATWQQPPLHWIRSKVAPRVQRDLTRYTKRNLPWHFVLLFVLGALLIAAAAGPFAITAGEKTVESHTVLFALDASLSMGAGDTSPHPVTTVKADNRFAQARQLMTEVIAEMPDAAFGLITFSGITVVHSPPSRDHRALTSLIETLTYHVNLTQSGTRFSSAFDALIHMAQHQEGSYQAVLLSDGELPQIDAYEDALDVLAELAVPIHTFAFGTTEGENRLIYEPEDVINNVKEKRVAREYHTRRVDADLQEIAAQTGGQSWIVDDGDWVETLLPVLLAAEPAVVDVEGQDKQDLSFVPLLGFVLLFLLETLVFWRRGKPSGNHRRMPRAPVSPEVATLLGLSLLLYGCQLVEAPARSLPFRVLNAVYHNSLGVGLLEAGQYADAEARFEKSMSYRIKRHVPLYNLGKSSAAQEEFAVAHDFFQEAMLEEPQLAEAHYNDGHALYRWGEQEIDREECRFERGRQLWTQAIKRFQDVVELDGAESKLGARSLDSASHVETQLAEIDELEATGCPPPPCQDPPPQGGGGGGGGGQGEGEGGGEGDSGEGEGGGQGQGEGEGGGEGQGQGEGGGEGDGDGDGDGEGGGGGGGLSEEENEQIRAALERIQQEAAGASGYRQSAHQQITEETVGKATGRELWW